MFLSPHNKVFTRIGVSKIHGVGVIAISDIPKDTYVFDGDKSEMVWVTEKEIEPFTLPSEIQKLYQDFCVIITEGGIKKYGCPTNFNNMSISWYLNNSKNPNVGCDQEYNFFTLRNIQAGEELTVDYNTYSEE